MTGKIRTKEGKQLVKDLEIVFGVHLEGAIRCNNRGNDLVFKDYRSKLMALVHVYALQGLIPAGTVANFSYAVSGCYDEGGF